MNIFQCDDCGRFIKYDDLDSGKARHDLIYPDSAYTKETWETLCPRCAGRGGRSELEKLSNPSSSSSK